MDPFMKFFLKYFFCLFLLVLPNFGNAILQVGIGKANITPPLGRPSAGYAERKGEGMEGVHDPLLALALYIDNGEKRIIFCSVDHLGFTYEMVQKIIHQVHSIPHLENTEIYVGSSHTHSGGGAYLNIPFLGELLAGLYNEETTQFYINKTAEAIVQAGQNLIPAKIGIGYGKTKELSYYRGLWPKGIVPLSDISIIKVTTLDNTPLAVLFNYPVHPTVLKSQNRLFSADFVGSARTHLQTLLGSDLQPIYFNGAQGDINPVIFNEDDRYDSCERLGQSLAETIQEIWNGVKTSEILEIQTQKESYWFKPEPTPFGLSLPLDQYRSEMNIMVFNQLHPFITIPGELSTIYDRYLKKMGKDLGFSHVSILGLTNDAHGYIITPESWRYKTLEAGLSFGGENYGELIKNGTESLLKRNAPSHGLGFNGLDGHGAIQTVQDEVQEIGKDEQLKFSKHYSL